MALFENAKACTFGSTIRDCEGECLRDSDSDGVCDAEEILGCMDTNACNFDENATESGGCRYAEPGYTCAGDCWSDKDGDGFVTWMRFMGARTGRRVTSQERQRSLHQRCASMTTVSEIVIITAIPTTTEMASVILKKYTDVLIQRPITTIPRQRNQNVHQSVGIQSRKSTCRVLHDGYRYDLVELNGGLLVRREFEIQ